MSDNFHQSIQGGTGANHVALGTGDAIWFSDSLGDAEGPLQQHREPRTRIGGTNSATMRKDGYSGRDGWRLSFRSPRKPGVGPVLDYLQGVGVDPKPASRGTATCATAIRRAITPTARFVNNQDFTIPGRRRCARSATSVLDRPRRLVALLRRPVEPRSLRRRPAARVGDDYCDLCNPFQYATSIMTERRGAYDAQEGHRRCLRRHRRTAWLPGVLRS